MMSFCSVGPLDVYLAETQRLDETSKKILKVKRSKNNKKLTAVTVTSPLQFIHGRRVDSEKLVMPILSQINTIIKQRLKLVEGRYLMVKERESGK